MLKIEDHHSCFPPFDLYIFQDYGMTNMDALPSPCYSLCTSSSIRSTELPFFFSFGQAMQEMNAGTEENGHVPEISEGDTSAQEKMNVESAVKAPKKEKAPSASKPSKSGGGKQKKKLSGSRLSWVGSHFSHKFGLIFKSFGSLGNEVIRMTWVPQLCVPDDQLSVQNKQHITIPSNNDIQTKCSSCYRKLYLPF